MVFKIVFHIPYDEDVWDPDLAADLRRETPGDPHGPHIKIAADVPDAETGERVAIIRCKHHSLGEVEALANLVRNALPDLVDLNTSDSESSR